VRRMSQGFSQTPQDIVGEMGVQSLTVQSLAFEKTHCKPIDLSILEQWVFGWTL